MKKAFLFLLCISAVTISRAQDKKVIALNAPDLERGLTVMKTFENRQSLREFSSQQLSLQDLSDLCWASNGFNRPEKRTAGTAMNMQEIDLYVCTAEGTYYYDAKPHVLVEVTSEDIRPLLAGQQQAIASAPVILLIAADMNRTRQTDRTVIMTAYDAGIVSQNISLFCSGVGMATVCRGSMDHDAVSRALGLDEKHVLHLNHPVGYPVE